MASVKAELRTALGVLYATPHKYGKFSNYYGQTLSSQVETLSFALPDSVFTFLWIKTSNVAEFQEFLAARLNMRIKDTFLQPYSTL